MARGRRGSFGGVVYGAEEVRRQVQLSALRDAEHYAKLLEDRRQFHPQRAFRPASSFSRADRRIIIGGSTPKRELSLGLKFSFPGRVSLCVRRKERREVLFAKKKTRKGSGSSRRRNWFSLVSC